MISNERTREILLAIVNNHTLEVKEDIKDICKVFAEQSLIHQLYNVFRVDYLKKYYLSGIVTKQYQDEKLEEIKDILNQNGIDFILLKGSYIKKYYPNHFLRLMGDIDILVRKEDFDRASEALIANGFIKGKEGFHHTDFQKNNISLELHHKLFYTKYSWIQFFDNPWENVHVVNNHEYEFDIVFFYLYQLAHLANHMIAYGAGIRPYIDFYYLFREYPIDINDLMNSANEIGLGKFLNSVLNVLDYFFDYAPYDYVKINYLDEYIAHILEVGVHGHSINNNQYANLMAGTRQSKFKFYLKTLFPSREEMKRKYPYLKKFPILFPIARIKRIFTCVFCRGKEVKKVHSASKKKEKMTKIFDEIGLNK